MQSIFDGETPVLLKPVLMFNVLCGRGHPKGESHLQTTSETELTRIYSFTNIDLFFFYKLSHAEEHRH